MIVKPELETIVTATDQVSLTASMSVMLASVPRSVTVSLSLTTMDQISLHGSLIVKIKFIIIKVDGVVDSDECNVVLTQ